MVTAWECVCCVRCHCRVAFSCHAFPVWTSVVVVAVLVAPSDPWPSVSRPWSFARSHQRSTNQPRTAADFCRPVHDTKEWMNRLTARCVHHVLSRCLRCHFSLTSTTDLCLDASLHVVCACLCHVSKPCVLLIAMWSINSSIIIFLCFQSSVTAAARVDLVIQVVGLIRNT